MKIRPQGRNGLSFVELAFVLATVALLLLVLLPGFRRTSASGSMGSCVNNLKQVGLAYRLWSNDNGDRFPFSVSNQLGGTSEFAHSPEVFRHFVAMSNDLVTPKVLVCPQDKNRSWATNFATFSNSNLSYFVVLDADESKPQRLLSGDRNITGGTLSNGFLRILKTNTLAGWTAEMHNRAGNIGLADGSAQQVTDQGLQRQLGASGLPLIRLAIP
jgi:hypothetical protein